MIFNETKLRGAYIIEPEKLEDERGFFARMWDQKKFEELGLDPRIVQCSISFNKKKGTLRGMHYQIVPYEETKLVRCTRGKVIEVMVDLRQKSYTKNQWLSVELSANNHKMLYVPEGFALGFETLEDNTELFYQMSQTYMPKYQKGFQWNDPTFNISWPIKPTIISKRDLLHPPFKNENFV